jgi:glycosyltransferase involved in cell wall biosynthesis
LLDKEYNFKRCKVTGIKILHVIRPAAGGMKNHVISLIRHANRDIFEPMAACPPGEMAEELAALGISVFTIPLAGELSPARDLQAIKSIKGLLNKNCIQILHAHSSKAALVGRVAARLAGTPAVFFTAHNSIFYDHWPAWKKGAMAWAERFLAGHTTKIIAVSGVLRKELLERERIDPGRVITIYNGIDPVPYLDSQSRAEVRQSLGLAPEAKVVGAVARLAPQKGVAYFVRAAAILARDRGISFLMVGDGPLRDELEAEAHKLGISDRIVFAGHRRDVGKILSCLDMLVLPSVTEGLPLIILEAMAAARPVVAAAVGGVPEVVEDGVTGILVRPGDEHALADAVSRLIAAPDMARFMGRAGRKRVQEHFTVSGMVRRTEKLYLSAFGGEKIALNSMEDIDV